MNYIEDFLDNYMKEWSNEDFLGLPVLGPMFSLFFEMITYQNHHDLYSDFIRSHVPNKKVRVHKIFS